MKNIVIISANPKAQDASVSLQMADYAKQKLIEKYPEANIITHNLYDNPILDLNSNILSGNITESEQAIFASRAQHLEEFKNADLVVLSMPMWNWNYPPQFKLYMDSLWVARETFAYNENGDIVGLLTPNSKKVILIASMGGLNFYKGNDHGYTYFKDSMLALGLGHNDVKYVPVQGSAFLPQDGHSIAIGSEKALASGKELFDFTLSSIK